MVDQHISRLFRLARRTGDRLIVTDEQGGGEPMVILPLEDYELLVQSAFGPSEGYSQDFTSKDLASGQVTETVSRGEWSIEEDVAQVLEDIHIEERGGVGEGIEQEDEADIDEEALQSLWVLPAEEVESGAPTETVVKSVKIQEGNEEGFYLEDIDS